MDPEEALRQIRELANPDNCFDARDCYLELAELVRGLDEWITRGGFLPADWKPKEP